MLSVERISQYTELESEAPLVVENSQPPKSWPSQGTIEGQMFQPHPCM